MNYKGAKTCQTLRYSDSSFEFWFTVLDSAFLGYAFLISSLVLFIESGQIDKYTSDLQYHFLEPSHGI
ncbi:MAG: hypothetical protein ACLT8V_00900 [Streptococcus salivarius]